VWGYVSCSEYVVGDLGAPMSVKAGWQACSVGRGVSSGCGLCGVDRCGSESVAARCCAVGGRV